jgi:hypothetical protein
MNGPETLIGKTIVTAKPVHDYIQLIFDDEGILSICNNFALKPEGAADDLRNLAGTSVQSLVEDGLSIRIGLSNGKVLSVGMAHDAQFGPEAMFYAKGELMIAWPNK